MSVLNESICVAGYLFHHDHFVCRDLRGFYGAFSLYGLEREYGALSGGVDAHKFRLHHA